MRRPVPGVHMGIDKAGRHQTVAGVNGFVGMTIEGGNNLHDPVIFNDQR